MAIGVTRSFDWYLDHLGEPSRWNERGVGKRDAHWPCPLGSGDDPGATSFHLTEKPDRVLLEDFAHSHTPSEVADALDGTRTPVVRKRRSRVARPAYDPTGRKVAIQVGDVWKPALRERGISPSDLHGGLATLADVPLDRLVILTEGHGPAIALNAAGIPAVGTVTGKAGTLSEVGAWSLYGRRADPLSGRRRRRAHGALRRGRGSGSGRSAEGTGLARRHARQRGRADFIARHGANAMRRASSTRRQRRGLRARQTTRTSSPSGRATSTSRPRARSSSASLTPTTTRSSSATGARARAYSRRGGSRRLTTSGWVVLLLDYEQNTMLEWAPRVARFGGERGRLRVVQAVGAIWDHADRVREEAKAIRRALPDASVYQVVDSIGYAIGDAKLEDSSSATKYKKALNAIGLPTLSLAHTTKANADPGTRSAVSIGRTTSATPSACRGRMRPRTPRALKNRKVNRRAPFETVEVDWSWVYGDIPDHLDLKPAGLHTSARIAEVLAPGPMPCVRSSPRSPSTGTGTRRARPRSRPP